MGTVYVKHYPDRIVIENPGAFPEGVNEKNIITHPFTPRNKLIAETLQRLKYVQRTGQGVDIIYREMISSGKPYPQYHAYNEAVALTIFSAIDDVNFVKFIAGEQDKLQKILPLSELMILRYLTDNKRIILSETQELTQLPLTETRKSCNNLVRDDQVAAFVELLHVIGIPRTTVQDSESIIFCTSHPEGYIKIRTDILKAPLV